MQLQNEKFLIIKYIKKYIIDLENLLLTFPKKDILSRDMMYKDALDLLELVLIANYENKLEEKRKYQVKALAKINKIDFYIERAFYLKYISEKQCNKKANEILRINKMLYTWCFNEK